MRCERTGSDLITENRHWRRGVGHTRPVAFRRHLQQGSSVFGPSDMNPTFIGLLILGVVVVGFVIRWVLHTRSYLRYLNQYPDEAYDFFASDAERWVVYDFATPELIADCLTNTAGLPQGKLLGPFQFRVPERQLRASWSALTARGSREARDRAPCSPVMFIAGEPPATRPVPLASNGREEMTG